MTDMACTKLMEVESLQKAPSQQQQWEIRRWMDTRWMLVLESEGQTSIILGGCLLPSFVQGMDDRHVIN
jgi:hypothetical protein